MTTFGLDIGTTSIRAINLKKSGNTFAIDALGIGAAPAKGLMSESAEDLKIFTQSIKTVIDNAKIKQREVNIALPESQVYTKIIDMPVLSDRELAASLKYEMEQYVPLPLDQVRTDWQILGLPNAQTKKMKVLLVAASLTLIGKYEMVLEDLGLVPTVVETEMVSIHRALLPLVSNQGTNMIIHMGSITTNIAIIENGEIVMVFSIDRGGIALTRAISLDLSIDYAQAESYKKAYGIKADAFEGKIGKALLPILETIISDIKKTILLYKQKNPNQQFSQVVLSGGGVQLPGIDIYLTNRLNTQVVLGNAFQIYSIQNVPSQVMSEAYGFNVVTGLALRDLV